MKRKIGITSILVLIIVAVVTTIMLPGSISASALSHDLSGYYMCKLNSPAAYDMDGVKYPTTYKYIGIEIDECVEGVVLAADATLHLFQANSAKGAGIRNGTGRANRVRLIIGSNVVTVTQEGTFTVKLPVGVSGTATTGTSAVTDSPKALVAGATTTITTTGTGTITVALTLDSVTIGTLTGVVGEGTRARYQLAGTNPIATVTNGTGTATGSPVRCIPASTTVTVSGAGTFTVAMPEGVWGTATSGTATLNDSPVDLPPGEETVIDTAATTGTITIATRTVGVYSLNGSVRLKAGHVSGLNGFINGFIILDPESLDVISFNSRFSGLRALD